MSWRRAGVVAAGLALAAGLGVGAAGVQVLPTRELVAESARTRSPRPEAAHYLEYLGPQTSASKFLANAIDWRPKLITFGYRQDTGYLGIPTLLFAALGLVVEFRSALTWFWVTAGAAGLLLSQGYAGWTAPLYELYASLPTGATFRTPERLQLLPLFGEIALAVAGFDAFARGLARLGRRRTAALGAAALASGAIAVLGDVGSSTRALVALLLLFLAVLAARERVALLHIAKVLLLLLVVADVWYATAPYGSLRALPVEWARTIHMWGHAVMRPDELGRLGGASGEERVALIGLWPQNGAGPVGRLHRLTCYEPLAPLSWQVLRREAHALDRRGLDAGPRRFPTLYDVASVRRTLTARPAKRIAPEERVRRKQAPDLRSRAGLGPDPNPHEDLIVELRENPDALPRAYLVGDYVVLPRLQAIQHVLRGQFDFQRRVILERKPWLSRPARKPWRARPAEILSYAPERVEIETVVEEAALLVLTDSHYPGWRAFVAGREVEILRANGLFRAVPVPAGQHRVVFEYAPASLRRGAILSATSLLGLAAIAALGARLTSR